MLQRLLGNSVHLSQSEWWRILLCLMMLMCILFAELLLQPLRHAPFLKALSNTLEYLRPIPSLPPTSRFCFPLLIKSSKVHHEVQNSSSFSASGVWNCCLPVQESNSGRIFKPALFGRLRWCGVSMSESCWNPQNECTRLRYRPILAGAHPPPRSFSF